MANDHPTQSEPTDAELDELSTFAPAFDQPTMMAMEEAAGGPGIAQHRRTVLAILTRSSDQLAKVRVEDAATFRQIQEIAQVFKSHLEGLLAVATAATTRLMIADCYGEDDPADAG